MDFYFYLINSKHRNENWTFNFLSNNKNIKEKKENELKDIIKYKNEDENKDRCFK